MAYLLVVTNLFCNHKCSYCIQQKSSLDVRLNPKKVDVAKLLAFLDKNRVSRSIKVMGGEATLHPDFEPLMNSLVTMYSRVVLTTNLNGKWYENFDSALAKMKHWGDRVQWNTTYHPAWMDADLYIERIRRMQEARVSLDQVATTDTPELTAAIAEKLNDAGIGWRLQTFTGRAVDGRLLPQTWNDVNRSFPQLYDPSKYIDHYDEYVRECEDANYSEAFERNTWVSCTTSRFLIGPDNLVYPCHRHLYAEDARYACGTLEDWQMKHFKYKWNRWLGQWTLPCHTKCNPCDFKAVKIKPLKPTRESRSEATV